MNGQPLLSPVLSRSETSLNPIQPVDRAGLIRLSEKGKADPAAVRTLKVKTVLESKFRHLNYIRNLPHTSSTSRPVCSATREELLKELTLLQAETEVLGRTPLDPVPEYSRAVMRLRLRSAEVASQAAQSALLHTGAKGFIVSNAPQRRIREAMSYSILTPSIKHLRKELS
jgi:hypothetical protein